MDDYTLLAQGNRQTQQRVLRTMLHCIDEIFRPLSPKDPATRTEPISIKKLDKGDACLSTRKIMLGWLLDTEQQTIQLPQHRYDRLLEILAGIPPTQARIAVKKWHQVLGELRSMTLAIPGLKGLFSLLQEAFRHTDKTRIRLSKALHGFLEDIRRLALDLGNRPTRMREIIPTALAIAGTTDACQQGMGGVFFAPVPLANGSFIHQAFVWRHRFPTDIQQRMVSWENPQGDITNSDLELAGTVAHHDVMAHALDIRERTVATASDNTPAVSWQHKGSTTTTGPAAYLLRLQAFHQRHHRYLPRLSYIPGPANVMADDASRLWDLSDEDFLTHFDSTYPQMRSWRFCHLQLPMLSAVTSALRRQRSNVELFLDATVPPTAPGKFGPGFAPSTVKTRSYPKSKTSSPSSKSTPTESEPGKPPKVVSPSGLRPWLKSYVMWVRHSPSWGPLTLD